MSCCQVRGCKGSAGVSVQIRCKAKASSSKSAKTLRGFGSLRRKKAPGVRSSGPHHPLGSARLTAKISYQNTMPVTGISHDHACPLAKRRRPGQHAPGTCRTRGVAVAAQCAQDASHCYLAGFFVQWKRLSTPSAAVDGLGTNDSQYTGAPRAEFAAPREPGSAGAGPTRSRWRQSQ
jgi:hypothetical protein